MQYIKSVKKIVAFLKGKPYTIDSDDERFEKFEQLLLSESSEEEILALVDQKTIFQKEITPLGFIFSDDGHLYYNGDKVPMDLATVIRDFNSLYGNLDNEDVQPLKKFIAKLLLNPNKDSLEDLYSFLQKGKLPITDEGNFLAYKVVSSDFKDKHTGTMDNSIGAVVQMPRSNCTLDRNLTCSSGLHFCSRSYIGSYISYGDKLVELEISPTDVVSIPVDYNQAKGRACQYKVIREVIEGELCDQKVVYRSPKPEVELHEVVELKIQDCHYTTETAQAIKDGGFKVGDIPTFAIEAEGTKACSKCKVVKPMSDFPKDKSSKSGYYSQCKSCKNSKK